MLESIPVDAVIGGIGYQPERERFVAAASMGPASGTRRRRASRLNCRPTKAAIERASRVAWLTELICSPIASRSASGNLAPSRRTASTPSDRPPGQMQREQGVS